MMMRANADMNRVARPRLRAIPGAAVDALNRLALFRGWCLDWCGKRWMARLSVASPCAAAHAGLRWPLDWDGAAGCVALTGTALEAALAPSCGAVAWSALDEDLLHALLQDAVDAVCAPLAQQGAGAPRLGRRCAGEAPPDFPFAVELLLLAQDGSEPVRVYVLIDALGLKKLASTNIRGARRSTWIRWSGLPMPVALELGWVDLPLRDVAGLRVQDILLPDCWWAGEGVDGKNGLCLRLAPELGIDAELAEPTALRAKTRVMKMEQDFPKILPAEERSDAEPDEAVRRYDPCDLGEVPVRIVFDLGQCCVPLRKLSGLQPGHVFDLALPANKAVNLRINGMRIGEGELVEIDGRIGVVITRIAPPAP